MPHSEYLELCAAYALGSLDAADRQRFAEHLNTGCPECATALREFREDVVLLARAAPAVAPPAALRERILDSIAGGPGGQGGEAGEAGEAGARTPPATRRPAEPLRDGRSGAGRPDGGRPDGGLPDAGLPHGGLPHGGPPHGRRARRRRPLVRVGAAFAAAVLIAVAVAGWWRSANLESELGEAHDRLAQLEADARRSKQWAGVFTSAKAEIVILVPTADGDQSMQARATYDPSTGKAVVVFDNLQVPDDRTLQLWALTADGPRSIGLIGSIDEGYAVMRVADMFSHPDFTAFAVSLEPAGGAPTDTAPTGPVVLVGQR